MTPAQHTTGTALYRAAVARLPFDSWRDPGDAIRIARALSVTAAALGLLDAWRVRHTPRGHILIRTDLVERAA